MLIDSEVWWILFATKRGGAHCVNESARNHCRQQEQQQQLQQQHNHQSHTSEREATTTTTSTH